MKAFNRTKIIATVGPSCNTYEVLSDLVKAGVDISRINFSHGTHTEHKRIIGYIHKINQTFGSHIGILADLQGPKIRIGNVDNGVSLVKNDVIQITNKETSSTGKEVFVNYEKLPEEVEPGEKILIDDGKIELQVMETNRKDSVKAKVIHGGPLYSRKGVNLPNTKLSVAAHTEKDLIDLKFALENKASWIAISFVRSAEDIAYIRNYIKDRNEVKVMAKIEKPEAMNHIEAIISEAEGIMIARGDLGVDVPLEKMPFIQKSIVRRCIRASKPVVVATRSEER